jgi:ketopantoate reductase
MLAWILLWVVLVLGAGAILGLLGLTLWRKAKALTREIGETTERLTAVLATINDVTDPERAAHRPATSYDRNN